MMFVFAIPDADGAPVEIPAGQGFTAYSVLVQTDADAAETGGAIGHVVAYQVSIPPGAVDGFDDDRRAHFLIQEVAIIDPPEGRREASHTIVSVEGVFTYQPTFEAIPPVSVPDQVMRVQGLIQLSRDERFDTLDAAAHAAGGEALIYWLNTDRFRRDNADLLGIWQGCGYTLPQLDDTFRASALITL